MLAYYFINSGKFLGLHLMHKKQAELTSKTLFLPKYFAQLFLRLYFK